MNKFDLGQLLRERELRLKRMPAEYIHVVPNEELVESFLVCSVCNARIFSGEAEKTVIAESEDAEDFITQINIAFKRHKGIGHTN